MRIYTGILFYLLASTGMAQVDSLQTDTTEVFPDKPVFTEYKIGDGYDHFLSPDTSIRRLQRFHPANQSFIPDTYLSILGAPIRPRLFSYEAMPGFRSGRNQFSFYQYHIDSLPYFRTTAPFTDIFFLLGQNAEQLFSIQHTQNFNPDLNINFQAERLVSNGFYQRERKTMTNIGATGWWRKQNYRLYGAFLYTEVLNQENGGLQVDSLFTTYQGPPALAEPWLTNAQTEWKAYEGKISQTFDLTNKEIIFIPEDTMEIVRRTPVVRLMHTIGAMNNRYTFQDVSIDRSFYPNIFETADTLRDISDIDGWYTEFSIFNLPDANVLDTTPKEWQWRATARYQDMNLSDYGGQLDQNNFLLSAFLGYTPQWMDSLRLFASTTYDVKQADVLLKAGGRFAIGHIQPYLSITAGYVQPDWMSRHYYGFARRWENDWQDEQQLQVQGGIHIPAWEAVADVRFYQLNNFIYQTDDPTPMQSEKNQTVLQASLSKNIHLGVFTLENRIAWQSATGAAIQVPALLADVSWYYSGQLFKGALEMQAGIDTWWVSDYYADRYDPVTGLFFVQTDTLLSFYPVTDVFLNFDIKTFRFFVKYENVTQGLFEPGYFEIPGYPMQNRSFKFGVNWFVFY